MEAAMKEVAEELASTDIGRRAVAFIKEKFPKKWKTRSVNGKSKQVEVDRNPKLTWKSYLLQSLECKGLLAKMQVLYEYLLAQ